MRKRRFRSGELRGAFKYHAGGKHGDFLQAAMPMGVNGGIKASRGDALVFSKQIVGEGVEIADAADHGRSRDEMIAVAEQGFQKNRVLCISFDEREAAMRIVRLCDAAGFAEI